MRSTSWVERVSEFLAAEDIAARGGEVTWTIESVDRRKVKVKGRGGRMEDQWKGLMKFKGVPKEWICNITNRRRLEHLMGSMETDDWIGREVTLHIQQVKNPEGAGKVPGICVKIGGKRSSNPEDV